MRIRTYTRLVATLTLVAMPSIVGVEARQQSKRPSPEAQAYMEYRKEVAKAKRLEDLYYYLDRQTGEFYKSLGTAERTKVFQQLKAQVDLFPDIQILKEDRQAQSVMLTIEALGKDNTKAMVTVEVIREGTALKIGQSTWK
jgi:hypothetical protein